MAGIKALSEVKMVPLVRDILRGKDLSQVTPRAVREEVISRLGDDIASDRAALKAAVKSALDVVLTAAIDEQEHDVAKSSPEEEEKYSDQPNGASVPEGDEDADVEGEVGHHEDGDGDGDGDGDDDDGGYSPGDDDEEAPVPRKRVEPVKRESQQRPKKRARVLVEEHGVFKSEKDFERLKKVCRRLGCTAPPSRQKGSTMREKCSNVLAYLRSKGVTNSDPTRLRKEEIGAHRKRIEREKDLEGLDVSNIIADEGRPKRRRAAAKVSKNEELPSDLSGPELSEKSEDEGEEFAVSDADSE